MLTAFNAIHARTVLFDQGYRDDFRLYFGAAQVGIQHGWSHLYDAGLQQRAIESLPAANYQPFVNPPPLAWLAAPLTAFSYPTALAIWTLLMLSCVLATWWLLAPGDRAERVAHLLLALGFLPAAFALEVGQVVPLVALTVAVAWILVRRDQPWLAGLVLVLVLVKPQDAILVPVALLAGGRWRVFVAFLAGAVVLALVVLAVLGPSGVDGYRAVLAAASHWDLMRRYSLPGQFDSVAASIAVSSAVLTGVIVLARRQRRNLDLVVAVGIAGSLLFSAYLGVQDLVMMLPAVWLVWRQAPPWHRVLTFGVYVAIDMGLVLGPAPVLLAEVAWLASLWFLSDGGAPALAPRRRAAHEPATG